MRNRLSITKLRIGSALCCRLGRLGLSLADLDLILVFARKTTTPGETIYAFAPEKLPEETVRQLSHLSGIAAIVRDGEVVDIVDLAAEKLMTTDPVTGDGSDSIQCKSTEENRKL